MVDEMVVPMVAMFTATFRLQSVNSTPTAALGHSTPSHYTTGVLVIHTCTSDLSEHLGNDTAGAPPSSGYLYL